MGQGRAALHVLKQTSPNKQQHQQPWDQKAFQNWSAGCGEASKPLKVTKRPHAPSQPTEHCKRPSSSSAASCTNPWPLQNGAAIRAIKKTVVTYRCKLLFNTFIHRFNSRYLLTAVKLPSVKKDIEKIRLLIIAFNSQSNCSASSATPPSINSF